jgi:hypothetical protein
MDKVLLVLVAGVPRRGPFRFFEGLGSQDVLFVARALVAPTLVRYAIPWSEFPGVPKHPWCTLVSHAYCVAAVLPACVVKLGRYGARACLLLMHCCKQLCRAGYAR